MEKVHSSLVENLHGVIPLFLSGKIKRTSAGSRQAHLACLFYLGFLLFLFFYFFITMLVLSCS